MARGMSRGSGVACCQSSKPQIVEPGKFAVSVLGSAPSRVWLARIAFSLHVGVVICLWPAVINSPAIALLVVTASLLLAVSMMVRPDNSQSLQEIEPTVVEPRPMRRNRPPVRAQVAPPAAPGAVLARDLDPDARAWADLMARISHDLRTPLNAVIGFSDLMQREAFGPLGSKRYQEYARHIQDCGVALLKSTEDTLAMTSALSDKSSNKAAYQAIALEPFAHDVWQLLATKAQARGIGLDVSIAPGLEVYFERTALRQILLNLMCEALSHAHERGHVRVVASFEGGSVVLEVSASGRCEQQQAGGLALCVARLMLHLHGGALVVDHDALGGWSAVTVLERARQQDFFHGPRSVGMGIEAPDSAALEAA